MSLAASKMAGIGKEAYNLQKPCCYLGWARDSTVNVMRSSQFQLCFFNLQGAIQVDF